jgi:energy-coupling factor transporter ATP-binding protein EcfA2
MSFANDDDMATPPASPPDRVRQETELSDASCGTIAQDLEASSTSSLPVMVDNPSRKRQATEDQPSSPNDAFLVVPKSESHALQSQDNRGLTNNTAQAAFASPTRAGVSTLSSGLASTYLDDETSVKRARVAQASSSDSSSSGIGGDWQQVVNGGCTNGRGGDNDSMTASNQSSEYDFSSEEEDDAETSISFSSRPFNMKLLRDSIENGGPTLERVRGKDVVLIIGKTGTGKSTLIQGIAGKKLHSTVHTTPWHDESVRKSVFEAEEALPGFEIGHAKTSMTKHINCYVRQQVDTTTQEKTEVVYLDSPGFEDTDGTEMDIATSVMMSQVAQQCKSLRFVILINYASLLEDRGGAMRSVLKLTRSFVQDFNVKKKSFMFLFTHTNEIKEIPDSIEGAKECLRKEIIRTADGTKDEDVLSVLDFMSKCLQKGFPFVDVFHPLKSDFSKLATFIENKLKPVTRPTLAGNCGLTISSRLKLEGELQNLLLIFRLLLNKDSKDIEQVKDIRKTFKYFEVYIDTEPVRKAVAESTALFDLHVANLHAVVNAEICRGTGPNHFSAANVGILKNTMSQLRALSNDDNCIEMTGILLKVETFQKELLLERGSSFEGLHQKLGKLHAWSEGFTEFSPLYSAAHRHISELIRDCNAGVTAFDANELGSPSHQQLSHHIRNLSVLKSICENSEHLSVYDLDVKTAAEQHDFAKVRMHSALQSWDTETAAAMKTAPFGEHIHAIAVRTATLEILQELLEKSLLCPCLSKTVLSVRSAMEDSVVERFTEICSGLKTRRQEFQSDYEQRLRIIRAASDLFDNRRNGRWKEMRAEYMLVVECFKSVLKTRSGELEEKSKSVREHGMRDGGREGQAFLSFVASQWFDGFLQPQQCFVENCVIKIRKNYLDRISEVKRDADSSFSDLFDDSRDSSKAVSALKSLLPELHQITEFASITQHDMQLSTLESVARSKLYKYVDTMDERTLLYLSEWTHALQNKGEEEKVYATTESLNRILHEIELLRTLDSECDLRLQTLQGNIHQVFRDFCGKVQGILTEGDYQTKADCLSSIEALGSFSHTGPRLPELEEMKDQVRTLVSADAQKIEEMIQETSEWDTIDQLLEGLEKARLLDHFTSNEATSRLSLLRKVREQKETEVDDLVDVLIREQNFTGIREFLAPLAASRDQMKKQKFERCRKMICSSLRDTVEDLHRLLSASVSDGTTRKIVRGLEILEPAQSELGKHISDELPLAREITNLKKRVNARLVSLVKLMTEAMLRSDYVQLGTNKWLATMFSKHTERHLKPAPRKKLNTAMVEYNKAIASVSEHMQMFFECSFKDGTPLIVALSSLKRAFESNDPVLEELSELYQASTKSLVQKLNEILRDIDEGVSETHCFDDAITTLDDLDRQLSRGLKDHIRPTDLQFDCTTLLAGWRRERQEQNRKMEFEGDDAESKIEDWAKNLDRLHASSWTGPAYRWMTGMTYGKLCKQLENKVATRFSQGKTALQTRDHNLVQECIFILDLISRKVGKKHIMVATTRLEDLKQRALNSFIGLCEQAQQVLVSESNRQFEGLFADYRSFVLYVPCIMTSESAKKSYGLTNQLIFETLGHEISQLEGMVASFDFALIKSKVEHVRAFGDFIADRCTLFHEEVKCCDHIDVGKWLEELRQLCFKHFSCGRNLRRIKQCAVLGVLPSASKSDISKAYKEKAKRWHPDKRPKGQGGDGSTGDDGAMFRKVKEVSFPHHQHQVDSL